MTSYLNQDGKLNFAYITLQYDIFEELTWKCSYSYSQSLYTCAGFNDIVQIVSIRIDSCQTLN